MRPTRDQLLAARDTFLPDVIARGLKVVFCGINPSLYSAAVGHHFARPGNRFWKALHGGGLTERVWSPFEDRELPGLGYGVTNLVARATARAEELSREELVEGVGILKRKLGRYRPGWVAVLGVGAYRVGFGAMGAVVGPQEETIGGVRVWVLPNPSGLNAHYQVGELGREFAKLREAVEGG